MPVETIKGNIFTSKHQTIVNTVNCVGVMGAGIALECRLRYPDMFHRYAELCAAKKFDVGLLWLYKTDFRWVLNFPTKKHWKDDSKPEYLHRGLENFRATYQQRGITSVAFPMLGADRGGLNPSVSEGIMREYLTDLDIPVTIYQYDPAAADDLFDALKNWLGERSLEQACRETGIRKQYMEKLIDGVERPDIRQINQLLKVKGIGLSTVEKVFSSVSQSGPSSPANQNGSLF